MPIYTSDSIYFQGEGKSNLEDCLNTSMNATIRYGLEKLVIFTAKGEGLHAAVRVRSERPEFAKIKLIGVTFPQGKVFVEREGKQPPTRIEPELLRCFAEADVPLVKARLPFDPIWSTYPTNTPLGQDMSLAGNVLNIFGGGMSLCVQAALMACDAGEVDWGEHIVVMSADTALLLRAAPTDHFMTDLIIREILCKPIFLTITRKEQVSPSSEQAVPGAEHIHDDIALLGTPDLPSE